MSLISRRAAIVGSGSLLLAGAPRCLARPGATSPTPQPADSPEAAWASLRDRFIAREGRMVDTSNNGVSHSEGQGYALLFAVRHDDRATFDRVLAWTRGALRRPGDHLHAWRWQPGHVVPVEDPNNATDGDLLIAWALVQAGAR